MIKWLWTANASVFGLALLILVIGLATLVGGSLDEQFQDKNSSDSVASDELGSGKGGAESPLVAMARKYSARLDPPKPVVKKPIVKKPVVKKAPKVVKPPKPVVKKPVEPPKKVIAPPNFTLDATITIGEYDGLAWIKTPKSKSPELYAVGETVELYEIIAVKHGLIELKREDATFVLKVPEPKPVVSAPTKVATPAKKTPSRTSRTRPTRTPRK